MAAVANGTPILANLGGSLPVPSVQALAASSDLSEIPQRYIRPEREAETILDAGAFGGIPILDLCRLHDPQHADDELMKLKLACEDWGFFQLINHGVPDKVIEEMKVLAQEFFKLPLEVRKASAQQPGSIEGYGQAFVVSEEQKLDWADMLLLSTLPSTCRSMNLWPTQPPTFRVTMEEFSLEIKRVEQCLLRSMSKHLGLNPDKLPEMFSEGLQAVRLNYYPPCPHDHKVMGISPHSDAVGLAVLLQVNEVEGLQIKKNGGWIRIKPVPGAFIVNIGDVLEVMTNGRYKSIEHRAIINASKERLSIGIFHNPNLDVPVGPIPELVMGSKACFKTVNCESYMKLVLASRMEGQSFVKKMKVEN